MGGIEPAKDGTMLMGDIVLTENEVTPVMTNLLQSGIEITALHNHLMRSTPATFYMHIRGHGDPAKLAGLVRQALAETKTPFEPPATASSRAAKLSRYGSVRSNAWSPGKDKWRRVPVLHSSKRDGY